MKLRGVLRQTIIAAIGVYFAIAVSSGFAAEQLSRTAIKAGPEYLKHLHDAAENYRQRDFEAAIGQLDAADKIKPNLPESLNMRGAIYTEKHDFEKAREVFQQALKLQPDAFWPKFNLAEILLMQKKAAEARAAFEKLPASGVNRELIEFKIILAYLLEGDDANAQAKLDKLKFPSDSAAYYFCHAAWEFAHHNEKEAKGWAQSGIDVFGPQRCIVFYDSLADMGWLPPRDKAATRGE